MKTSILKLVLVMPNIYQYVMRHGIIIMAQEIFQQKYIELLIIMTGLVKVKNYLFGVY